ncbi:outer membrane protein [Desulfocapsa sulfexigens DSM 10523]|uniref:Translocation and assembly module subunit TamA n=2 Tax=Desulfocapsa TaxID=53318 RepID=M1NGG1_DESSD|nr:outer membrane protein [Desulfocapsa sulfexigens DSM 10523]
MNIFMFLPSIPSQYVLRSIQLAFSLLLILFSFPAMAATPLSVDLTGLEAPFRQNVLLFLDINKMKNDEDLTPRWIKKLHQQAPQEIREALQPFGYYIPEIRSALIEEDGQWFATYRVDKGEPVVITGRDVQWFGEGMNHPALQQSIKDYLRKAGKTLIHAEYEAAKNTFMNIAFSNGYPKARFITSEWLVDLDSNTAKLTLHMDTGPLYYFGNITFLQDFLNPDLLTKYITMEKGTPYSYEALLEFQQNLIASNYAREVTITPRYEESLDQQLPLTVIMKPIAPHKFTFGVGYDSDTGIRGSARWDDRLLNRYGHHSELSVKLAWTESIIRAQYNIPVVKPLTDRWVSTASYEFDQTPDTSSATLEMETAFVRRNLADTLLYKGFVLASSEQFSVEGEPDENTALYSLGGTFRFSDTEESIFPQYGDYLFIDLRGASEALLSDTSYARLHMKGRYMVGLGKNGRIDTQIEIGTTWVEDFDMYPATLRFFAGGDTSVRGYSYESLGPKNANGVSVGGKNVVTGSLEYDHRVSQSWVLAGFVDAGNAYNDKLGDAYVGAGVGLRWLAPFGSLRIDIAYPVSESPELNDWRFHIGFGATL